MRCSLAQKLYIFREHLDDHRLGSAGEVADHVLQALFQIDVDSRLPLFDLIAHVIHDFIDAALTLGFQFYGNVAPVCLGDGRQSKLQAGASRGAFHFRHIVKYLLNVRHHAISLLQRCSGRRKVIQDKTTLIHFRKKVGTKIKRAGAGYRNQHRAQYQEPAWMFQGAAQPSLVELDYMTEETFH